MPDTRRTWARRRRVLVGLLLALLAVPSTATADRDPRPEVGVHAHLAWLDLDDDQRGELLDRLVDAGVDRVRVDLSWASLEPDGPGTVDTYWDDRVATVLADLRARDLHVLAVLWQTPTWASPDGRPSSVPADPSALGRFLDGFASRHGDAIDAYEVWNEPNQDDFWTGDAADYVAVLEPAAAAIRYRDPTAQVVLGAPAYNDSRWVRDVYAAGAAGAFDVMATHPYMAPSDLPPETVGDPGDIWLLTHVEVVHDVMTANGDADLPIWFTEMGWHTRPDEPGLEPWERGVTPAQQAEYLVRAIDHVAAAHPEVTAMYWYNARDREGAGARNDSYGLLTRDLTPKPVYWALRDRLVGPDRLAGGDRIDTSVLAATLGWSSGSDEVVVVRSDLPSDAVVATPLAATMDAPVLLTTPDRLDDRTAREVARLGVRRVTVVGGPDAVSDHVLASLRGLGVEVRRIAGGDRAGTAAAVARLLPGDDVVLVDGWPTTDDPVWPDALVAGDLAVAGDVPAAVLLSDDTLPRSTRDVLDDRRGTLLVLGTGATTAVGAVRDSAHAGRAEVLVGDTVTETSALALRRVPHAAGGPLLLATSHAFPDGLVGVALADRLDGRLLLVDPDSDGSAAAHVVDDHRVLVLGGTHALPQAALPR